MTLYLKPCFIHSSSTADSDSADALEDLARDLSSSSTADKERAVSMLSSLTLYLEYHNAMMEAGVFPALIKAILDARMVPQVRSCCQTFLMVPCSGITA
jgi:hypothetical protein